MPFAPSTIAPTNFNCDHCRAVVSDLSVAIASSNNVTDESPSVQRLRESVEWLVKNFAKDVMSAVLDCARRVEPSAKHNRKSIRGCRGGNPVKRRPVVPPKQPVDNDVAAADSVKPSTTSSRRPRFPRLWY